jgi:hypothetical protein
MSPRELSSWKEIAAYLNVSVRTAQAWERERGLPIRRLPGARSQVRVLTTDLNNWKLSGTPSPAAAQPTLRRPVALIALALVLAVAGALLFWPRTPAKYRVEQQTIIVTDSHDREIWRRPIAPQTEGAYQQGGRVWIGDLGNGRTTVLFLEGGGPAPGSLIAFNRDGSERWRFTPGRAVRSATESIAPSFHAEHLLVAPLGRDGKVRVALTTTHDLSYPCQIALLDRDGHLLREYWHSGHLQHLMSADLTHLGWNSLVVAGISNARKTATLLVLDPDHFNGASAEDDAAYQLQDFPPPVQTARILLPRSDMNKALEPFVAVTAFRRAGDSLTLEVQHRLSPPDATLFYRLTPDLKVDNVTIGSSFERAHLALEASGILKHRLGPEEMEEFHRLTYLK